jgi:hypothetical protein
MEYNASKVLATAEIDNGQDGRIAMLEINPK